MSNKTQAEVLIEKMREAAKLINDLNPNFKTEITVKNVPVEVINEYADTFSSKVGFSKPQPPSELMPYYNFNSERIGSRVKIELRSREYQKKEVWQ